MTLRWVGLTFSMEVLNDENASANNIIDLFQGFLLFLIVREIFLTETFVVIDP